MRSCCEHFASVRIRFAILPVQRRRQLSRVYIACLRLWTIGENVNTVSPFFENKYGEIHAMSLGMHAPVACLSQTRHFPLFPVFPER